MEERKKDIPEKGAIIQRDGRTYAIVTHTPGGLVTPFSIICSKINPNTFLRGI